MPKSKEELQDLKMARALRDMMLSDGWKHYRALLELHLKQKTTEALTPVSPFLTEVDGIKQVLFGESAKGAIMGLRLALSLPQGIVDQQLQINPSLAGDDSE